MVKTYIFWANILLLFVWIVYDISMQSDREKYEYSFLRAFSKIRAFSFKYPTVP